MCSLCWPPVAKNHNFGQILTFRGSCTRLPFTDEAKFSVLEQTKRLHLHGKLHLNVFIVSASGGQKPQFWTNFDVSMALVPTPFNQSGPNLVCYSTSMVYAYVPNFVSVGLLCRSIGEKPQFLPFFGLRHLVVSLIGSSLRMLNTGAQLQTFPYPTASKSLLYSNGFMAKSGAQTLTFKSVTDRQTNRQKNSTFLAALAAGEILGPPNLAR